MKTLQQYQQELADTLNRINRLEPNDGYLDAVSRSFPLGRVGGSGRHTRGLNKRRERALERTIDNAGILVSLYQKRDSLTATIKDLQEGGPQKRQQATDTRNKIAVHYWKSLKEGDTVHGLIYGNSIVIIKKNEKSIIGEGPCKWDAAEIIGREAAKMI